MTTIAVYSNATIFTAIGLLHFYWAMGGKRFSEGVLPVKNDGTPSFVPGVFATIVVAIGLLGFAALTLANLGYFENWLSPKNVLYGNYAITAIFALRAIGDFYYVGFFKKIKNTTFAKKDTAIYSPLCLIISVLGLVIVLNK